MKYHIFHDFRTSTSFKEKSSDHFKDLHKRVVQPEVSRIIRNKAVAMPPGTKMLILCLCFVFIWSNALNILTENRWTFLRKYFTVDSTKFRELRGQTNWTSPSITEHHGEQYKCLVKFSEVQWSFRSRSLNSTQQDTTRLIKIQQGHPV